MRAVIVSRLPRTGPPPDFSSSPLYLLAVLLAARRSKDRALERLTRRQLDRLGVRVAFGDDEPEKGVRRA
jgi:hypothetical protein